MVKRRVVLRRLKQKKQVEDHGRMFCEYCDKTVYERNSIHRQHDDATADHIIPRAKGGKDTYDNIAVCCWECNWQKRDS